MKNNKNITAITLFLIAFVLLLNSCGKMNNKDNTVLLTIKDDPTISFRIWFKTGSQDDPDGKEGLAALTAAMLTDGATRNNSYEQILNKLYRIAASYSASVDMEMTIINGRVHKDNLEEYYKLFTDAIMHPAFNEDDFNRIKSQMLNYLENTLRYSSDEELGKAALYNFIFDGTPYGHLATGTVYGLKHITLQDVENFYKKHYTKNNYVIGLGGGFDNGFTNKLNDVLAKLPDEKQILIPKPEPKKIEDLNILIVDKPCDATAISFGFPIDVLRGDKDFFALFLFNSWFGEHRNQSSHLYQVIREKRGMNYGDYSYIETFLNGGNLNFPQPNNPRHQQIFEVWLRPVQHQHAHFALRAAIRELDSVIANGLTQEQFELTKNFLYNYALFYAQTTSLRLGFQIDSKFYGIDDGGDYIQYFRNKIKNLTLEEVNQAIKKHIQSKNMKIAIVTTGGDDFKVALVNNTPSPVTYLTAPSNEILEEDKIIENYHLDIFPEKVNVIKVDRMFAK